MGSFTGRSSGPAPGPGPAGDRGHWLAGGVAVVPGASGGFGAATAEALAAAGAHVVLAARDRVALANVAGRIRDAGGDATPVPADVSNDGDVGRLFAAAAEAGPVCALVCAAAVLEAVPFAETTPEIWEETLRVNLTGSFLCCRAAFPATRPGGGGRIGNIGPPSRGAPTENVPRPAPPHASQDGASRAPQADAG